MAEVYTVTDSAAFFDGRKTGDPVDVAALCKAPGAGSGKKSLLIKDGTFSHLERFDVSRVIENKLKLDSSSSTTFGTW